MAGGVAGEGGAGTAEAGGGAAGEVAAGQVAAERALRRAARQARRAAGGGGGDMPRLSLLPRRRLQKRGGAAGARQREGRAGGRPWRGDSPARSAMLPPVLAPADEISVGGGDCGGGVTGTASALRGGADGAAWAVAVGGPAGASLATAAPPLSKTFPGTLFGRARRRLARGRRVGDVARCESVTER